MSSFFNSLFWKEPSVPIFGLFVGWWCGRGCGLREHLLRFFEFIKPQILEACGA
jgi:hypothetical protein